MPIKIEQITRTGIVVSDYDHRLNPSDIKNILDSLPNLEIQSNKNPFIAKYRDKTINLCVKSISYLGIPHLHYKKRIQIPKEWKEILQEENTLLLGIYSYKNDITFCLFDATRYKDNQLNNSSAHIRTMDLHKARKIGIFKKIDKRGNNITVFTKQNFQQVLDAMLFNDRLILSDEFNVFNVFSQNIRTDWFGIDCYNEMMEAYFNNAYQPEWAGFYLEYKFRQFIDNNPDYRNHCQYIQNKSDGDIDLDLWFENKQFYGDLKAHTIDKALLGNDKASVQRAIEQHKKVWYIVFSHYTKKDRDCGGKVTNFWNTELNKRQKRTGIGKIKKLDSYISRMKNSIKLDNYIVLEINEFNAEHLSDFQQGRNSNNQDRNTKISIKNKDLKNDNFVIYRQKL